jgi:hypothetical protein
MTGYALAAALLPESQHANNLTSVVIDPEVRETKETATAADAGAAMIHERAIISDVRSGGRWKWKTMRVRVRAASVRDRCAAVSSLFRGSARLALL